MANTIRQYLAEVEEKLRHTVDDQALQSVLSETEGHLRDSAKEIESLGFKRYEAEERAIAAFGGAEEYGEALATVEPPVTARVSPRVVLAGASIATASLLLWPLLIRQYPWYHPDAAFASMLPAALPVGLVFWAALFGSRVRARKLYLIALAGGVILVPILAARFVGSQMMGGIVVRSIELRTEEANMPAWDRNEAQNWQAAIGKFEEATSSVRRGVYPVALSPGTTVHGFDSYAVDPTNPDANSKVTAADWLTADDAKQIYVDPDGRVQTVEGYLAPASPDNQSSTGLQTVSNVREAKRLWREYGEERRSDLADNVALYNRWAQEAQARLDEPYLVRLRSMASWGLVMALVWGTVLVGMQAAGLGVRKLLLALADLLTKLTPASPA